MKNIKFLLYSLLFLVYYCVALEGLKAHSLQQSSHNAKTAAPFPARQVEENIAVEFYYKSLPEDERGYEKDLSAFIASITTSQPGSGVGDQKKTENKNHDPQSLISGSEIYVGQEVAMIFKVTDATMNWPIQGLIPDCPIRFGPGPGNLEYSRKEILKRARLLGGHFLISEYTYLFILNSLDGTVSVMDTADFIQTGWPVKIISLSENPECKGIDIDMEWLGRYAYVTLDSEEVVVIDCARLQVIRRIKAGRKPHHVLVQPDGKYAWVCNDGDGTVTVIDTGTQEVVKTITVGRGHHEIAFTSDSRYGCVTNRDDDSVTIIDVYTLASIGEVPVGDQPHGLGYSKLSQYMYVANEGDGTVSVVDLVSKEVARIVPVGKGVRNVRFGPDLRWGFAPNKGDNTCSMIDVTRDIVVETIKTGKGPEDVSFAPDWVFIRNTGSSDMTAMSLEHMVMLATIPIGSRSIKPNDVELPMGHISMAPQGDGHSILIPDPGQRSVYRYMPGEGAGGMVPTDVYSTQGNGSSKLVVYYRGLKEVSTGVFTRVVRFGRPGRYEVAFYVDNPELTACFELNVLADFYQSTNKKGE